MKIPGTIALALVCAVLSGCETNPQKEILGSGQSAVQLRSYQQRAFDTTDKEKSMRAVIATLQDLGFVVDKADSVLGTITGTKLDAAVMRVTVTVRPRGTTQTLIRANAQYGLRAIEDPKPYQNFFNALEKAIFLTAHQVD